MFELTRNFRSHIKRTVCGTGDSSDTIGGLATELMGGANAYMELIALLLLGKAVNPYKCLEFPFDGR